MLLIVYPIFLYLLDLCESFYTRIQQYFINSGRSGYNGTHVSEPDSVASPGANAVGRYWRRVRGQGGGYVEMVCPMARAPVRPASRQA